MERNALEGGGSLTRPFYERMEYQSAAAGGYPQDSERNRERALRAERDNWNKAVDEFIDERRLVVGRERSPQRERERSREWKDKRRDSREREYDRRGPGNGRNFSRTGTPRDGDSDSNSSDGSYKHRKRQDGEEEKSLKYSSGSSRSSDSYREEDRKYQPDKVKDTPRDAHGRNYNRKRDDYDGYDSSETKDSDGNPYRNSKSLLVPEITSTYEFDKQFYKDQDPNRTIIIRGLAQHITESDIWQDTVKCNLMPKDIRLIRRKDTGTSRGFAFVEFLNTSEAVTWMEMKQGELMLKDQYRAVMQYSLQRFENGKEKWVSDWHCKCSAHNFKRRDFCYRCGCSRQDGELVEGYEDVCAHPTYTVLLRGLDALTTEENVLQSIQSLSSLPIRSVEIGRDTMTNTSRGVCYLRMNSVVDAVYLHNALLMANPVIDGKQAVVSYCRLESPSTAGTSSSANPSTLGSAAIAAAHWSHQKTNASSAAQYTLEDVNKLAEYSANLYATNAQEKACFLAYYKQYYQVQISKGNQISLPSSTSLSAAPTVVSKSPVESKAKITAAATKTPLTEPPNGLGTVTYPVPDVSTYQYDKTSGYYYDPYTTLYYDANSQYYYNQKTQAFLYWDAAKNTYLPAPTSATVSEASKSVEEEAAVKEEELKKAKEKEKLTEKDKVKVAKRIAKDMEKWAKTLNHKKEIARQNLISAQQSQPSVKTQGAADIGFAVLERKDLMVPTTGLPVVNNNTSPTVTSGTDTSLVAAYGQGSESEDEDDPSGMQQLVDDKQFTDWTKLACLLCKRQFPTRDVLVKHQQLSDLHKQNLEQWYKARGLDPNDANRKSQQYRDRAKERRLKYGEPDQPQPNRLKETYMKAREATVTYEEPTKRGLGSDNLGNKLLQKMGWQEGMGLGKKNQGRTSIIETERRSATAGLGTKSQGVVPGPGETYKDCVRKMMKIRYQEIEERAPPVKR